MIDAQNRAAWSDKFMPGSDDGSSDGSEGFFTLAMMRGVMFRQRLILIGVTTVILVLGIIVTLMTKPIYQAEATVRVEPNGVQIVEGQDLAPDVSVNEINRFMNTQGSVIQSRSLAYQVVDDLKLYDNRDFLGKKYLDNRPVGLSDKQWLQTRRDTAAAIAQGGVSVTIPMDNRVIAISFHSPTPQIASLLANGYADAYVKEDLRRSLRSNEYARKYLQDQITEIGRKVQEAEMKANAYAKQNRIVGSPLTASSAKDESAGTAPTITVGNLTSVNETYTKLRSDRISAEQRWRAIAGIPASQLPEVQQNPTYQELLGERSKQLAKIAELRQRYGESYPQIRETRAQIATLDSQIAKIGNDIKNSARDAYLVALRQEQGIASELNKVADETLDEQDRRVRYNLLDREAGALRAQLAALLERFNQISAAANIDNGTVTKLDSAETPSVPSSPDLAKNLLVALVAGVGLAVGAAVLREAFDDRLRSSDDVERKLGTPLLGFTPHLSSDEMEDQIRDPFSALMEAYSSLRTSIDFAVPDNHRVLQITSSQPSEGKSLTSTVLARKYAQLGRQTLLIDADLRKPTISALFGSERKSAGFGEVLLGDVPLQSALLEGTPENLDVLPVGPLPLRPVELLSSTRFTDFLQRCRESYDLIIIDSSPVMGLADAPLIAQHVDGVVFIVEANRSHYGQAKAALRRLRTAGGKVAGAVLTKYRSAEAGYSYDYTYNYYSYGDKNSNE